MQYAKPVTLNVEECDRLSFLPYLFGNDFLYVSVVHGVVRELMEEKRASRQVTVPAVMLEKVMALAGSEMKRLYPGRVTGRRGAAEYPALA